MATSAPASAASNAAARPMPRLPPVMKMRWPVRLSMEEGPKSASTGRAGWRADSGGPGSPPPIAEAEQKDVGITAVGRDHPVPGQTDDPVLRDLPAGGERHQGRHGRGDFLAGDGMLVVNEQIRTNARADKDRVIEKRIYGPQLGGEAVAPDNLGIALVNRGGGPVEMRRETAPVFQGEGLGLFAEKGVHDALTAKRGELIFRDIILHGRRIPELAGHGFQVAPEPESHTQRNAGGLDFVGRGDAVDQQPAIPAVGKIRGGGEAVDGCRAMHVGGAAQG